MIRAFLRAILAFLLLLQYCARCILMRREVTVLTLCPMYRDARAWIASRSSEEDAIDGG